MIRSSRRRLVDVLGSAGFATVLLAVLGVWAMLASAVPQGPPTDKKVAAWASGHFAIEPLVRLIGLHQAFTNPLFIAASVVLGISTAICAWNRTKTALQRAQTLRRAGLSGRKALIANHDFEVACDPSLDAAEARAVTAQTLARLGVKTGSRDDMLVSVSPRWAAWGSPIFHWALLGLLLSVLVGQTLRAEGLMGIVVGETKPDAAASYGVIHTGPLHNWIGVHRSIRVDSFEPNYRTGGVNRGPTPTVSLLDGAGNVVRTQRVYPNNTIKAGPLTIYPSAFGLAVTVSEVDTYGAVLGRGTQLVDFSTDSSSGTIPVGYIDIVNAARTPVYRATLTVPLDPAGSGGFVDQIPQSPAARIVAVAPDGSAVADSVVRVGETLSMPGAAGIRVDDIRYYARLQVVDDWTIPLLYAGLAVALVGLSIATLARQQIVLATVVDGPDGVKVAARVRIWRNGSTSRSEIEKELAEALRGAEKESTS